MEIRGEVAAAELGDKRLAERLVRLAEQLAKAPGQSFPKAAGSEAALEATYRFLGNEDVTPEAILAPHIAATVARCEFASTVFVAHDTTEFRFSSEREGLGRVAGDTTHGFLGHFALAVAAKTRAPLGVLGMVPVFRERRNRARPHSERHPSEERESKRWLDLIQRVDAVLGGRVSAVHVMDREADAYELLAALCSGKHRFIVRLQFDRAVDTTLGRGRISDVVKRSRTLLTRDVELSARVRRPHDPPSIGKKHPYRTTRMAKLRISAASVTICRPPHVPNSFPKTLRLNVVRVHETDVGAGIEPVEWRLVTSEPIDNADDAAAVVDGYRARWLIEEYFKALKQGCAYEKRQLESKHALLNALAVFTPIAWQLLALRQMSRDDPELPADRILSTLKLRMLQRHPDVRLGPNATIREAMLAIAALGGHIKNNGDPGWAVLGRGYEDLLLLERGAALALEM
jgi:IS4 transposase